MRLAGRFLILMWIFLAFPACQRGEDGNSNRPTIALVVMTLNNPFFVDMETGAEAAADSLNVNLLVQASERQLDVERQVQIIENLIQRRVDVICIAPTGSREVVPAIVKANEANIPVLIVDSRLDAQVLQQAGGHIETYIGSDNYDGGRLAAKFLVDSLGGSGSIAILEGIPGQETGDKRLRGFLEVVNQEPDIKIVASQTANWDRAEGFNVFQNILESNPEVEAVFAANDMMALGAVEAISQSGRQGDILVVGFDAVEDARQAIARGEMTASIAQHPYDMGQLAVEYAVQVVNGQSLPPEIPVRIELITAKNAAN